MSFIDKGEETMHKFVTERLQTKPDGSDPPTQSFFSLVTRNKVKTMTEHNKQKITVKRTHNNNSEVMFQRLLAVIS